MARAVKDLGLRAFSPGVQESAWVVASSSDTGMRRKLMAGRDPAITPLEMGPWLSKEVL